jgi:4-hydroxy-tetrahydrodipicolinate reductase
MTSDGPNPATQPASDAATLKVLLVGYGKMGRLIEQLAGEQGVQVVGHISGSQPEWVPADITADVAIDFSTAAALAENFPRYLERGLPVVIGTTGWSEQAAAHRAAAQGAGLGVVAAANFSIGVNLFELMVAEAARLLQAHPQYGAWIHESHHAAKRDAPSGTALMLRDAMTAAGYRHAIDLSSTRAGMIPGTHTIGFDAASDTIELTHRARDRRGFASGALLAARWLHGRRGWFSMADVLRGEA